MANGRPPEGHISPAVTHAEIPSPYAGPAPSPTRSMDFNELTGQNPIAGVEPTQRPTLDYQPGVSFERTAPPAPTSESALLRPTLQSSPPPDNSAVASEIAALRAQVGELINNIGARETAHQSELQEMRFRMELAGQPPNHGGGAVSLPPDVDPNAPVTAQQFANFLTNGMPQIQGLATASAIRAGWDVSPAEEQAALASFPQLSAYPEPDRTTLIRRAVALRRTTAPSNGAPHPAPVPPAPLQTRDARPTVPHPEITTAPMVGEPPVEDEYARAVRDYQAAEAAPTRNQGELKQKLRRMRDATDRINRLRGVTEEMQRGQGFREVG